MFQRFLTALIFSLFLLTLAAASAHAHAIEILSSKIADEVEGNDKKVIAVVDFTNLDGEATPVGQYIAEEVVNALLGSERKLEVVDRMALRSILKNDSFAEAIDRDPSLVRRIGESEGVEMIVTGTATPFRDRIRISVKLLDTATEKVVWGTSSNIQPDEELKELLAGDIRSSSKEASSEDSGLERSGRLPQFKNGYLRATVTSVGLSTKYKTAVVGILVENISKNDIRIALHPPADQVYLVETSARIVDDKGIHCRGAEASGIKQTSQFYSGAFSLLTARSATPVIISFNCDPLLEGDWATLAADFFAEIREERADFSMGISNIKVPAIEKQEKSRRPSRVRSR